MSDITTTETESNEVKPVTLDPYPLDLTDSKDGDKTIENPIRKALESGDLILEDSNVTATADRTGPDGKVTKVKYQRAYKAITAKTAQGALVLAAQRIQTKEGKPLESNEQALLRMVSDSYDKGVQMNVRNSIVVEVQGPEAQIDRIAKQFAKLLNKTEAEARVIVMQQPEVQALLAKREESASTTAAA